MSDGSLIFDTKLDASGVTTGLKGLGGVATTALGVFAGNMLSKAADGLKSLSAGAFQAYSDFEQLKGGIETIFKDSAETVMKDADESYAALGLSANKYMELTTSFSASLIQSTGGDTAKAAKYAKMAITDMADNANKMGTDITAIQNAYQGFAKQNYTMLDNLKLGYGGTKTEMERLLKDARKITGIKYNINNLNDVYSAIHVIQGGVDELNGGLGGVSKGLGIAGSSAQEASTTIEGSMKTLKASWENLQEAIADPDADVDQAVKRFVGALKNAWKNAYPVIRNVGYSVIRLIGEGIYKALEPFKEDLAGAIGSIFESIGEFIQEIAGDSVILRELGDLISFLGRNMEIVLPVVAGLTGAIIGFNAALTIQATIKSVSAGIQAFKTANDAATISQAALNAVMNLNPFVLLATLVIGLVASIVTLWNTNEGFRNAVINAWNSIKIIATNVFEQIAKLFTEKIPKAIEGMLGVIKSLPDKFISVGKNIVDGLWKGINAGWRWLTDKVGELASGLLNKAKEVLGIHSPSRKFKYIGEMCVAGFDEGIEPLEDVDIFGNVAMANEHTVKANVQGIGVDSQNGPTFNFYDVQTSPDSIARKAENTFQFGFAGGL